MPPLAEQGIIYKFGPGGSWDGSYIGNPLKGSISGTTFNVWSSSGMSTKVLLYKQTEKGARCSIQRLKCTFSLDTFPDTSYYTAILTIATDTAMETDPLDWHSFHGSILVYPDGKLALFNVGGFSTKTSNSISAGTSYDLELLYFDDPYHINGYWQIWIDGDLWLEFSGPGMLPFTHYSELIIGFPGGSGGPGNVAPPAFNITLTFSDVIWTIEELPKSRWTMMAPRIVLL